MKKVAVFVIFLVLATGFAIAQDYGFTVGGELGVINGRDGYDNTFNWYVMPTLAYDTFLMDEALELYAELGVPFGGFPAEVSYLGIDLDFELAYNIGSLPLSVILGNQLSIPVKPGDYEGDNHKGGTWYPGSPLLNNKYYIFNTGYFHSDPEDWLSPGAKYSFVFNPGTLSLQADLPLRIAPDAFDSVGLNISVGWQMANGLGFKFKEWNSFNPNVRFFQQIDLAASYALGSLYGELDVSLPLWKHGFKQAGLAITPKFEYIFKNGLKFYSTIPLRYVGADKREKNNGEKEPWYDVGLTAGIRKSF